MRYHAFFILLLVLSLNCLGLVSNFQVQRHQVIRSSFNQPRTVLQKKYALDQLIQHQPIYINGNDDLIMQAEDNNWSGIGSSDNPFIIRFLNISSHSHPLIGIRSTDLYIEITDCYLQSGYIGIFLYGVENVRIINNIICNNQREGIGLYYSHFNLITGNSIKNNGGDGIHSDRSSLNVYSENSISNNGFSGVSVNYGAETIVNNTISSNSFNGIRLEFSAFTNISKNAIVANANDAIHFYYSVNNSIISNTITSSGTGIYIYFEDNTTIQDNSISFCRVGMWLMYLKWCIITSNNFLRNYEYAIDFRPSRGENEVSWNIFTQNNLGGISQARDDDENLRNRFL